MAVTLTALDVTLTIRLDATAEKKRADDPMTTPRDVLNYEYTQTWSKGNGAGEMDMIYHEERDLGASASEDFDLAGNALYKDCFGDILTLANVKLLIIENVSAAAESILHVGGAAATSFDTLFGGVDVPPRADEIIIKPGECKTLICAVDADGYDCTGGADDLLKIHNQNAGAGASYKIIVGGDSA